MSNMQDKPHRSSNPEVPISIVSKENLISISQLSPPLLEEKELGEIGVPVKEHLQILVGARAYSTIDEHTQSDLSREVGGFLIGRPHEWNGNRYVEIIDALPGVLTSSSAVHLTISPDTWARVQETVRKKFPDLHVVGWYHTHPNMSVFLSSQDMEIHKGFFRESWHVALVVEPSKREAGFFVWHKESVISLRGYRVSYPPSLAETVKWKPPSPPPAVMTSKARQMLEEFCQSGFWHTRWMQTDEVVVRVKAEVMQDIKEQCMCQKFPIEGFCMGRVRRSKETTGSQYFVEIVGLQDASEINGFSDGGKDFEIKENIVQEFGEANKENAPLHFVGWYYLRPVNEAEEEDTEFLKSVVNNKTLQDAPWAISLVGDRRQGFEKCHWKASGEEDVVRQLIEIRELPELMEPNLNELLTLIVECVRK